MNAAMTIISKINQNLINPIILLAFAVALIFFIFGVLEYLVKSKNDPSAIKAGAKHMGWGLFGMFIMVSVFGFLQLIINTFPIDNATKENVKKVLPIN
ncbi:MAG: hypothetical protein V4576_01945 [Patescibacteria group bacterium]